LIFSTLGGVFDTACCSRTKDQGTSFRHGSPFWHKTHPQIHRINAITPPEQTLIVFQYSLNKRGSMMGSELQVVDIQLGDGKAAVKGALITTQYNGFLEDGTTFDSSYDRGKPFQCVIGTGRVIKGWDQGLMGMKVGGKRKLFVPAHLAYGERQVGTHIKPNSNLIFDIELLEVLTRDD
jgi:peptidylprolyl isomerase